MKRQTFHSDAEFDRALDKATRSLDTDIQPTEDLWPHIESALGGTNPKPATVTDKPKSSRTTTWFLGVAASVLLVIGSSLTTLWWTQRPDAVNEFVQSYGPESSKFGSENIGAQYTAVRAQLIEDLESRLPSMSPETQQIVKNNLRDIEVSLAEINVALESDPNNASLQRLLAATYQQELNMLSHMNQVVSRPESVQL